MRRPWAKLVLHQRVVVNLLSGRAVRGVLWGERGGILVLKDARFHGDGSPPEGLPVDGEVLIERAQVDFAQVLPAPVE